MALILDVAELLSILRDNSHPDAAAYERILTGVAANMGRAVVALSNDHADKAGEVRIKRTTTDDEIEVWGGRLMLGFEPEDDSVSMRDTPIPSIIAGYDDEGWV